MGRGGAISLNNRRRSADIRSVTPRVALSLLHLQTDARLARLAAAGDSPAFAALVARHRPALQRHCERILTGERAHDAVQ